MNIKTEKWLDHEIRFVEIEGEWWAVAKDIADALGYSETRSMTRHLRSKFLTSVNLTDQGNRKYLAISEHGIYKAIMRSQRPEAEQFEDWVLDVIVELRKQLGLEQHQVLQMTYKERQKQAIAKVLEDRTKQEKKPTAIKVNQITNKALANIMGEPKAVKKGDTPLELLELRQDIFDYVTDLEKAKYRFGLDVSVSKNTYQKFNEDVYSNTKKDQLKAGQ